MSDRYLDIEIAKALGWMNIHHDETGELVGHCPDHAQVALEGVPHWGLVFCGHCKDCQWWIVSDDTKEAQPECAKLAYSGFRCWDPKSREWIPLSGLMPPANFGCVQFERKEKEE